MIYTIYFEIFGKKMKTTISASSEHVAKEMIRSKIIFNKIEKKKETSSNSFADILGLFK